MFDKREAAWRIAVWPNGVLHNACDGKSHLFLSFNGEVRKVKVKTYARMSLVIVIFSGLLLIALPLFGDAGDPPNVVARLSYMDGAVSFEPAGENDWAQASLNYPLTNGDRLWTDKSARAELETGNVAIRMSEQTDLTTTSVTEQLIQLGLAQGTVRVRVYDLRSGNQVEVDTPNAALSIVQAGNYRVEVYPDQNMTMVIVNSGQLQISGNGVNQTLQGGQAVQLTGTNPVQVGAVAVPALIPSINGARSGT